MYSKKDLQKPPLKWVGGKTQILEKILEKFPTTINNYHELFLGGGSVLLGVLSLEKLGHLTITGDINAYDCNHHLINFYKHLKNNKEELYRWIIFYKEEYSKADDKEAYYYKIRDIYNSIPHNIYNLDIENTSIQRSAIFLFLNKTCFRGIYRESKNGFNVPFGHYKTNPTFITREDLDNTSQLIQKVEFHCLDFSETSKNILIDEPHNVLYIDPPYVKETNTSFVGYNKQGFTDKQNDELFTFIKNLKNAKFILSNSNVNWVKEYFKEYNIEIIKTRRSIHSKKPGSTANEVIIYN